MSLFKAPFFKNSIGFFNSQLHIFIAHKFNGWLKAARDRKRKKEGRCEGVRPYGRNEVELDVLKTMKEWRGEGMGLQEITDLLNCHGLPSPSGVKWCVSTVHSILTRENIKKGVLLECQSRGFELHQLKIENFLESETLEGKRENDTGREQ